MYQSIFEQAGTATHWNYISKFGLSLSQLPYCVFVHSNCSIVEIAELTSSSEPLRTPRLNYITVQTKPADAGRTYIGESSKFQKSCTFRTPILKTGYKSKNLY